MGRIMVESVGSYPNVFRVWCQAMRTPGVLGNSAQLSVSKQDAQ